MFSMANGMRFEMAAMLDRSVSDTAATWFQFVARQVQDVRAGPAILTLTNLGYSSPAGCSRARSDGEAVITTITAKMS